MDKHFDFLFNNPYNIKYAYDNNGIAWFNAKQIGNYLGRDAYDITRYCPEKDVKVLAVNYPIVPEIGLNMSACVNTEAGDSQASSHGGARRFTIINELGLYYVIPRFKSDNQEIENFRYWLSHILLLSVRRHDAYIGNEAIEKIKNDPGYVDALVAENERLRHMASLQLLYHNIDKTKYPYRNYEELKQYKAETQQFVNIGKVLYHDSTCVTLNTLAKMISQSLNRMVGINALKGLLREHGYLMKTRRDFNMPTQLAVSKGYLVIDYTSETSYEILATPLGVNYFINLAINEGYAL